MSTSTENIDTSHDAKLPLCRGCRDDYYNRGGNSTCGRCLSLGSSTVVERFRIGWWTLPTLPTAYTKVVTLDCHHSGQYAQHTELPQCFPEIARVAAMPAYDARKDSQ